LTSTKSAEPEFRTGPVSEATDRSIRLDGATGSVTFFGAINGDGEVTLRYSWTICFAPAKQ
jgi:hypothetical protein